MSSHSLNSLSNRIASKKSNKDPHPYNKFPCCNWRSGVAARVRVMGRLTVNGLKRCTLIHLPYKTPISMLPMQLEARVMPWHYSIYIIFISPRCAPYRRFRLLTPGNIEAHPEQPICLNGTLPDVCDNAEPFSPKRGTWIARQKLSKNICYTNNNPATVAISLHLREK